MLQQLRRRALLLGVVVALQWSFAPLDADRGRPQTPATSKRPLSYDAVDSWRSIQGTRLSDDGHWLIYSLTSQGEDGEVVVRNLRTGQEFRHPRGTGAVITPDSRFVVFTIAQSKADEEKERLAKRRSSTAGSETQGAGRQGSGSQAARNEPKTGLGIIALPLGQVTTIDKVGSFSLPDGSASWLAYHKGLGGDGGRGGAGGRGGGRGAGGGRQGAAPAQTEERPEGQAKEKRKDPGADLHRAQSRDGRGSDDSRGHGIPVGHDRRVARVRGIVDRRGQGWRLCAADERRSRPYAALGSRTLQKPRVR